MSVSLCACGGSSSGDTTTVLVGISPDYAPYESLNTDNEMEGFDIDMTEKLFQIMNDNGGNYTYEFKQMSFDEISTSIKSDNIDLGISGFTYHEDWDGLLWSEAYNDSKQVALIQSDSDIKSADDLQGKSIGAQLGATGADVANDIKEKDSSTKVTTVEDAKTLVETLKSGGLDAVILDDAVAENYANANDSLSKLDETLLEEENLIIAKEGKEDLMEDVNAAIKQFTASDEYTELKEKWGC